MWLQSSWGQEPSGGSCVVFGCPEFFCLDISLGGGWRKAVSHMTAPRGPVLDPADIFQGGVVPGPSGDA